MAAAAAAAKPFDERFFEAFAFVFAARADFALRLLRQWLASAHAAAEVAGGASAEARRTREAAQRRVRALLRMLLATVRQFAPSECTPAQFSALAPAVVRHFHSSDAKVAKAAEALLGEMVSRAPRGTPPSIFNLRSLADDEYGTTAWHLAPGVCSDEPMLPLAEAPTRAALGACVERLQVHVLAVPADAELPAAPLDGADEGGEGEGEACPLAALEELPADDGELAATGASSELAPVLRKSSFEVALREAGSEGVLAAAAAAARLSSSGMDSHGADDGGDGSGPRSPTSPPAVVGGAGPGGADDDDDDDDASPPVARSAAVTPPPDPALSGSEDDDDGRLGVDIDSPSDEDST